MKIARVIIKNYRNLTNVEVPLSDVNVIIGRNNSGKSNFLRAITLPLISEDLGSVGKNLYWTDFGNECKKTYYAYLAKNLDKIKNINVSDDVMRKEFSEIVPEVSVRLEFEVDKQLEMGMDEFLVDITDKMERIYAIEYRYSCKDYKKLLHRVIEVLKNIDNPNNISNYRQTLLPVELFSYSIMIPGKEVSVSYDSLKEFKYNSIAAERDDFSKTDSKIGSKALIQILDSKLEVDSKIQLEDNYNNFFESIKSLVNMEKIINWQESSEIVNATEFFKHIDILPNMPAMYTLLNNVRLGYDNDSLSMQGLGHRNLILQLVLITSLIEARSSLLSLLTIEEPEAHLCYQNEEIMVSYINSLRNKNLQLVYATHSNKFIDKFNLDKVIIFENGKAYALGEAVDSNERAYLAKNPNLDLFKLFYSKNCILVEGISEELLIKAYIQKKDNSLNNIEVLSFHKGFKSIIEIWLKINKGTGNKLGIIRDFDNEEKSKSDHERYNQYKNIQVATTKKYTLEDDFVNEENNFEILKDYFEKEHNWVDIDTPDKLSDKWKKAKAQTMYDFCMDLSSDALKEIKLPKHIQDVMDFMQNGKV